MDTLPYQKTIVATNTVTIVDVPIGQAIKEPIAYATPDSTYRLLSSALPAYLIHRYAPMLTCSVNPEMGINETYAELYVQSPTELIDLINSKGLLRHLEEDIQAMYAMYDKLEVQVKQLDDYQNGRLNY